MVHHIEAAVSVLQCRNTDVVTENKCLKSSQMEKESVGNVDFYKCKKCPYMTLSTKDLKFHWQSFHASESEMKTKESEVIIKCPGCSGIFHLESSFKVHLRSHHKMGPKDVAKLAFALIKEYERKKEFFEKLEVVVGGFKCEEHMSSEENVPPTLIQVPPDPGGTAAQVTPEGLEQDTYKNGFQIASNHSNEDSHYDLRLTSEPADPSDFPDNHQHFANSPVLDNQLYHIHKPLQAPSSPSDSIIKSTKKSKTNKRILKKTSRLKAILQATSDSNNLSTEEKDVQKPLNIAKKCGIGGCGAKLISNDKMLYHKSCHLNNSNELFCPECEMPCSRVESLHSHLWCKHKIDLELHSCDQCSYKAFKISRLNNIHKRIHFDDKPFSCEVCSKTFKNYKQLANHKLLHELKKYTCQICKRELKSKRQVLIHTRAVHEKKAQFHCEQCHYSAATKHSLLLHIKSHSGKKPFECEQCSFWTSIRSSLRRHVETHAQNKKYVCEHCTYACVQASSLKRHIITKHPNLHSNLIHQCPFCSYESVNIANFTVHMSTHPDQNIVDDKIIEKNEPSDTLDTIDNVFNHKYCNDTNKFDKLANLNLNIGLSDIDNSDPDLILTSECVSQQSQLLETDPYSNGFLTLPLSAMDKAHDFSHFLKDSDENSILEEHYDLSIENTPDTLNKSDLSGHLLQYPPTANIQTVTKKPSYPIILVKPKSQLLHLPLQNNQQELCSTKSDNLPRKKPKISVKSNLILKGPDNFNNFNCNLPSNEFTLQDLAFGNEDQSTTMPYDATISDSQNTNAIPLSKLITRDPFMSDDLVSNYLLTSNFFSNLQFANISNNTLLIQPSSEISSNKPEKGIANISMASDINQGSDISDIKLENKPYIPPQSELSCTSLNDNGSGSGSMIYEVPKHTIPIKFENKSDVLGPYSYHDELFENESAQMQNISIIEELPASFENLNGMVNVQGSHLYGDNLYTDHVDEMLDEEEIIVVDDTSCEMKSVPFGEESNFSLTESDPFYKYHSENNFLIPSNCTLGQNTNNGSHVKEKPRILSQVHITGDKNKINFSTVNDLGLKLEFPSVHNIEWTLALLKGQQDNKS